MLSALSAVWSAKCSATIPPALAPEAGEVPMEGEVIVSLALASVLAPTLAARGRSSSLRRMVVHRETTPKVFKEPTSLPASIEQWPIDTRGLLTGAERRVR
jgi:hypothetical protein